MAQKEQPFVEEAQTLFYHLNELRLRLTYSAIAIAIGTLGSFYFAGDILNFLLAPYAGKLQVLRPTEGLEIYFKVALLCGLVFGMPVILYQLWQFVAPGLTTDERKYVYFFVPAAFTLFLLGILFAWFVLVPAAVSFLANFMPDIFQTDWTGQEYIGFIMSMIFWLGVSFEMPIVAYFVARVGVLEAGALSEHWRYAVVGISVLAAAITPSIDPVTMLLTMAPLLVLYFVSIGTAYIGQKQFAQSVKV